jgi:hypothetical protein
MDAQNAFQQLDVDLARVLSLDQDLINTQVAEEDRRLNEEESEVTYHR